MTKFKLDPAEVTFSAIRSRGPGGQNVNKVSSSAKLTWDYSNSEQLSSWQKGRITNRLSAYINKAGIFYLRSDEFRDLERNKDRCLEKLDILLEQAFKVEKIRRATKPSFSSKLKRLDSKKVHSTKKNNRKKIDY